MILDGLKLNTKIRSDLKLRVNQSSIRPKLAIIQVGESKQSEVFILRKIKFAEKIGVTVSHEKLPTDISQDNLEDKVGTLNNDQSVHGIIIQLPISDKLDFVRAMERVSWKKDVDGLGLENIKKLWFGENNGLMPATVRGILELLDFYGIDVLGKKITIINRSFLVGKPLALALLNLGATVSICHSQTTFLRKEIKTADIVITAVGKPKFFTEDFFESGQVVIDVGISQGGFVGEKIGKLQISGDVDFDMVSKKVSAISPVPGGVGPMTVAALFENLLDSCNI